MTKVAIIAVAILSLGSTAAIAGHGQVSTAAKADGPASDKNMSSSAAGGWSTILSNPSDGTAAEAAGK